MMKLLLLTLATTIAAGLPANAALVSYSTTGLFTCAVCTPTSGTTISSTNAFGTSSITYTGAVDTVDAPPSPLVAALNLGSFTTTSTIATPNPGATFLGSFVLTITELSPTPTSGSPFTSTATYNGTLRTDQSGIVLSFSP